MFTVTQFVSDLRRAFPGYVFHSDSPGHLYFSSACVYVSHAGVQLGKIRLRSVGSTRQYEVVGWRFYKPREYEFEPRDRFFYLFESWLATGRVPYVNFPRLVNRAKQIKSDKIAARQRWRALHPRFKVFEVDSRGACRAVKKKRKSLEHAWMGEFRQLVSAELTRHV